MAKRSKKKKRKSKSKKKKSFKRKKKKILRKKKKKISSKKKGSRQIEDSDGNIVFKVPPTWEKQAYVNQSQYTKKYKLSKMISIVILAISLISILRIFT